MKSWKKSRKITDTRWITRSQACKQVNNYLPLVLMKCSQFLRLLIKDGWYIVRQKGSHIMMRHRTKQGQIVFANHGSQELGKGMESKLRKAAGLKRKK